MELPEKQAEAVYWRPGQTQRHMRAPRELDRPVLVDATLSPEGRGRASWRVFCLRAAADLIAALILR